MKEWNKYDFKYVVIFTLLVLLGSNIMAAIFEIDIFLKFTKVLVIPLFFVCLYVKGYKIEKPILAFLVLFFIGDLTSMVEHIMFLRISSISYSLSYFPLIYLVFSKLQNVNFNKVIGVYLLVVFFINVYLTISMYNILKFSIVDDVELFLFSLKSIALVVLGFTSFVVYLSNDSKQSILFLAVVFHFLFSNVLYYINHYYVYNWSFIMLDRVFYIVGLLFLFSYVMELNEGTNRIRVLFESVSKKKTLIKQ